MRCVDLHSLDSSPFPGCIFPKHPRIYWEISNVDWKKNAMEEQKHGQNWGKMDTLPETNSNSPLLGWHIFRGKLLVSGRVTSQGSTLPRWSMVCQGFRTLPKLPRFPWRRSTHQPTEVVLCRLFSKLTKCPYTLSLPLTFSNYALYFPIWLSGQVENDLCLFVFKWGVSVQRLRTGIFLKALCLCFCHCGPRQFLLFWLLFAVVGFGILKVCKYQLDPKGFGNQLANLTLRNQVEEPWMLHVDSCFFCII